MNGYLGLGEFICFPATIYPHLLSLLRRHGIFQIIDGCHSFTLGHIVPSERVSVNYLPSILGLKTQLPFLIVTAEQAVLLCLQPMLLPVHLPTVFISLEAVKPFR